MTNPSLNAQVGGSNPSKPTVVLVHGVAGSLHIWDPIFDALCEEYRVVRLDLLGYGHSPKPRLSYTPEQHVDAIRSTLKNLAINPPYMLVGLSMGSTLVLQYAAMFPDEVRSLIAIGYPYYASEDEARTGLSNNLWAGLTINHPMLARVFVPVAWRLGRMGVIPPKFFAHIYSPLMAHDTLLNPYRVFRSNVWHSMVQVDAPRLLAGSSSLNRLFIHGSLDKWATAASVEKATSQYRYSRFTLVPEAEHNVVVLEPALTTRLILDFLRDSCDDKPK